MIWDFNDEQWELYSETLKWCIFLDDGNKTKVLIKPEVPQKCKDFYNKFLAGKQIKENTKLEGKQ